MKYLLAEAAVLGGIVASTIWWGRASTPPSPPSLPGSAPALPAHVTRVRRPTLYDQDTER